MLMLSFSMRGHFHPSPLVPSLLISDDRVQKTRGTTRQTTCRGKSGLGGLTICIAAITAVPHAVGQPSRAQRRAKGRRGGGGTAKKSQGRAPKVAEVLTIRLSGGLMRGQKINSPDVLLRPMMYQVRETLFSMLSGTDAFQQSAHCLDMFSGSGILGLECVSRGTGRVSFVDSSGKCAKAISDNCQALGVAEQAEVFRMPAEQFLAAPEKYGADKPFDLVTLTPPYEEVSYEALVASLVASPALGEDALVVIEYGSTMGELALNLGGGCLQGLRSRKFGRTVLAIYVCRPSGKDLGIRPKPEEFGLAWN